MASNQRKTQYVSLEGGTNITSPVLEIPEGDFIYTFNMEPNKTKGVNASSGYERIDGNHINPSNAVMSIYKYSGLTGDAPVQGDSIASGVNLYTVCGIIEDTVDTGTIYLIAEDIIDPAVSVFTTGSGGFITSHYRFIQRLPGSKFTPSLLSDTEKPFYNYCVGIQRTTIEQVPGEGPILGVSQDPSSLNILAVRKSIGGVDKLFEAVSGTGWVEVTGTSFTNATRYRFYDIQQGATSRRIYIVNGVDDLHYYDSVGATTGTIAIPLLDEPPKYVGEHDRRVVVASGIQVVLSSRETPDFTIVAGAVIVTVNYTITGIVKFVDDSMLVATNTSLHVMKGSPDSADPTYGTFKEHSRNTGAIENTIESSEYPYFINNYGISLLADTDNVRDYSLFILSDKVTPLTTNRYDDSGFPINYVGAHLDKGRELYRTYRADGSSTSMLVTEGRLYPIMFNKYDVGINCTALVRNSDLEYIIAGSGYDEGFVDNYSGYVYKMESGGSLDGDDIVHSIKTPYVHMNSPAYKKRFFKFTMNVSAPEKIDITYKADFDIGNSRYSEQLDLDSISGTSRFNLDSFNAATWSGRFTDEISGYINGSGTNISLNINISNNNIEDFSLQGLIYHYSERGLKR